MAHPRESRDTRAIWHDTSARSSSFSKQAVSASSRFEHRVRSEFLLVQTDVAHQPHSTLYGLLVQQSFDVAMAGRASAPGSAGFRNPSHRLQVVFRDGFTYCTLGNVEAMAQRPSPLGRALQYQSLWITEFHETSSGRKEYKAGFAEGWR